MSLSMEKKTAIAHDVRNATTEANGIRSSGRG